MAKTAKATKPDPADSFETVAKALGCDDDKARFEARLGKIAHSKPKAKRTTVKRRKK